jgi:exosortase
LIGQLAAEFFLQRSSIVMLIAGAIVYLAGWRWLRVLLLPLLLLELCIPLPAVLWHQVSMPLQLVSSAGAAAVLRSCGLAVYRNGNILQLPHQKLNVIESCSGLRSLMSMIALALVLISSSRLTWWVRVGFVVSAAAVAVIANTLRISGTGLLGEYVGSHAIMGRWHLLEGWFVFVVAFLMLSAELGLLQRLQNANPQRSKP